jgi:hypothetical protein
MRRSLDTDDCCFYVKEFWWRKILEIVQLEGQKVNEQIKTVCYGDTSFIT